MGVWMQYFAALSASLGALSAGCALGWTSNLEHKIRYEDFNFEMNDIQFSLLGSMLNLGAALACIIAGFMINWIGRRSSMLLIIFPFSLGWLLLVTAVNSAMLIFGRTFIGIACGAVCVCCPVYIGEIAEKQIRGRLGSFFQLLITSGIMMVYLLGAFTSVQITSGVCGIIPIIFAVCLFFCPESPTYYVMKDKTDEAKESLKRLRDNENSIKDEMKDLAAEERARKSQNAFASMGKRSSQRALIIALSLMFFQQFSGINAVIFYTNSIFVDARVDLQPEIATIIVGVIQVIATFFSTMFVDKIGRKILLITSFLSMAFCTGVLGIYYGLPKEETGALGWLPLLSLCVFIVAFSIGAGPIPWLCISEIFASDIRPIAGSTAGTLNWMLAFVVTITFPPIREAIGPAACFYMFAVLSVIGGIFSKFVVIETKGKSFAEIQKALGDE